MAFVAAQYGEEDQRDISDAGFGSEYGGSEQQSQGGSQRGYVGQGAQGNYGGGQASRSYGGQGGQASYGGAGGSYGGGQGGNKGYGGNQAGRYGGGEGYEVCVFKKNLYKIVDYRF